MDGKHVVFGRISEGLEVVSQLKPGDKFTAKVIRKRPHEYRPETIPVKAVTETK